MKWSAGGFAQTALLISPGNYRLPRNVLSFHARPAIHTASDFSRCRASIVSHIKCFSSGAELKHHFQSGGREHVHMFSIW
jgi:hypothetical protein